MYIYATKYNVKKTPAQLSNKLASNHDDKHIYIYTDIENKILLKKIQFQSHSTYTFYCKHFTRLHRNIIIKKHLKLK